LLSWCKDEVWADPVFPNIAASNIPGLRYSKLAQCSVS
jgi:hypothetical protein